MNDDSSIRIRSKSVPNISRKKEKKHKSFYSESDLRKVNVHYSFANVSNKSTRFENYKNSILIVVPVIHRRDTNSATSDF